MSSGQDDAVGPEPENDTRGKIVIAGTGRAGTTLLVQVLTDLGLDTGFERSAPIDPKVNAGLERSPVGPTAPWIVKSPQLSRTLGQLLDDGVVRVDHVIIPIRDLDVAAASRVRNTHYGSDLHTWGGLLGTNRATRQQDALALMLADLLFAIVRHDIDHTLLLFPRFTADFAYTYEKLSFLAPEISSQQWKVALAARVNPTLIHERPLSRSEQRLTVLGTAYNRGIARPIRGLRKLVRRGA